MHKFSMVLALAVSASRLAAGEVSLPHIKVGNEVYSNVTVTSVSATDIYFIHARGGGNAKLKDLAPSVQKQFGYDPAKAAVAQQDQANANLRWRNRELTAASEKKPEQPADMAKPAAPTADAVTIPRPELSAKSFLDQRPPQIQVEKWLTPAPNTQGKFVLLDIWATWCGPCRASIPKLNQLQRAFTDRLVVIGLSNEPEANVRHMKTPAIEYPMAIDTQSRTGTSLGVTGIPHCVVIDPKGIVRYEGHPGYLDERIMRAIFDKYGR